MQQAETIQHNKKRAAFVTNNPKREGKLEKKNRKDQDTDYGETKDNILPNHFFSPSGKIYV